MKFKNNKDSQTRELNIWGPKNCGYLQVQRFDDEKGRPEKELWLYIGSGVGFRLTRAKALKLAWAIINELQPDWETAF